MKLTAFMHVLFGVGMVFSMPSNTPSFPIHTSHTPGGGNQFVLPVNLTSSSVSNQFAQVTAVHDSIGDGYSLSKFSIGVVELVGRSGQIRITPNSSNSANWVQLKWDHLIEYDASNTAVAEILPNSWARSAMTWQSPIAVSLNVSNVMYNATKVVFNGTVTLNSIATVDLSMSVYLYAVDLVMPNGNQSLGVSTNQVKFDIDFGPWPFQSDNNTLHFGVSLSSSATDAVPSAIVPMVDSMTNNSHQLITVGQAQLISPSNAFADGNQTNVVQGITNSSTGDVVTHWVFPHYITQLHYDPVLSSSSSSTSTTSIAVNSATSSAIKYHSVVPTVVGLLIAAII